MHRRALPLIGILALVAACSPASAAPRWTYPPRSTGAAPSTSTPPAGSPASSASTPAGQAAETLEVEAFDLGFKPSTLEVPAAGRYEVELVNTGAAPHDITFADGTSVHSPQPGETATGEVDIPADGHRRSSAPSPGHAQAGMKGAITVGGAAAGDARQRGRRPRRSGADDRRRGRPERAGARRLRPGRPGPPRGRDPRHRPGHDREGDDGRRGLRPARLDVRRHRARARSSGSRSATPSGST